MERIVGRCEEAEAYLIADEVYIGAENGGERTPSFWGMSDRVIVTSGLSKAYGIPGIRVGWMIGPRDVVYDCWSQHDYITIGPNKLSDRMTRVAVQKDNREKLYGRTARILEHNLPLFEAWVKQVPQLEYTPSQAGAFSFVKLRTNAPCLDIATACRQNESALIVPGSHLGMEGYLRIWLGGREEYITAGWERIERELARW